MYDEPALGDTVHGRDAIRDFVVMIDVSFPDHKFFLEGLYADVAALRCWSPGGLLARTPRLVGRSNSTATIAWSFARMV